MMTMSLSREEGEEVTLVDFSHFLWAEVLVAEALAVAALEVLAASGEAEVSEVEEPLEVGKPQNTTSINNIRRNSVDIILL